MYSSSASHYHENTSEQNHLDLLTALPQSASVAFPDDVSLLALTTGAFPHAVAWQRLLGHQIGRNLELCVGQ